MGMEAYCPDHGEVMKCLGSLERGQGDIKESLEGINTKLSEMRATQNSGITSMAVEKVKSSMLYWVLLVTIGALVVGVVNVVLKAIHIL